MNTYLRRSALVVACIVCLAAGAPADRSLAESVTAKENLEKLKKTNSCRGCDLSGLTLNRLHLAGADLEGADLSMVKFFLTNLSGANLKNSNLKGTSFGGCDLGEADLRGADLRGTSLDGAYLGGTLLDGEFVTAKPYEDIGVADVEKQIYIDDPNKPKKIPETREVSVSVRRDLEKPQLLPAAVENAAKLRSKKDVGAEGPSDTVAVPVKGRQPDAPVAKKVAPVQRAIVEPDDEREKTVEPLAIGVSPREKEETVPIQKSPPQTSIADSGIGDLSNRLAKEKIKRDNLTRLFDQAQCLGCDLSGLDLSGKNLKSVDLEKANLTGCNLELVILDNANLKEAILRNANLRKASLHNAELSGADLTGANVDGAVFGNATTASAVDSTVQAPPDK
jgi:uncharacterized protein YjbI with pentapeptide repeats